ncbi:MAG: TIGR01777 family oxidoreductase [Anaerolineales bacterium]
MKILIAGGSGFIGLALTSELINNGHQVTILTRKSTQTIQIVGKPVQFVHWDVSPSGEWVNLLDDHDGVINLSGENIGGKNFYEVLFKRWNAQQKQLLRSSRIQSGEALTQAIISRDRPPAFFIQASAVGYYGQHPDQVFTEESPPGNDFLANLCVDWENSTTAVEQYGVRRAVIRIAGIVMGKDGGSLPFLLLPYKFFVGGPLGNGSQWVSWIHLKDLVRGIIFLMENKNSKGAYNLCSPNPITNRDLNKIIGRTMQRPSFMPFPEFAFRLIFGEKADALLASQKQIPQRLIQEGFQFLYPTADMALKDILEK